MINQERLCYAYTTDGQMCRATAIRGQLHCYAHGPRGQRRAEALRHAARMRQRHIPVTIATLAETVQKDGLTRYYPELMAANARLSAR